MLLLSHLITADSKSDKQYVVALCGGGGRFSRLSSVSKFTILVAPETDIDKLTTRPQHFEKISELTLDLNF